MKFLKYTLPAVLVAISLAGCASSKQQESTGQYLDNSVITAKVKAKLASDEAINSLAITVNSYKNTVQLSGFVDNKRQEFRAVQMAKEVEGVKSVKNDLIVKQH